MNKMSKRIALSAVSTLIAVSMIQSATAAERTTKHHVAATANEQIRNANASAVPFYVNRAEDSGASGTKRCPLLPAADVLSSLCQRSSGRSRTGRCFSDSWASCEAILT